MLQVRADPDKTVLALKDEGKDKIVDDLAPTRHCTPSNINMEAVHLQESRACLPEGLQEMHLKALRRHAALLSGQSMLDMKEKEVAGPPPSLEDLTTGTTTEAPTIPAKDQFTKTKGGKNPSYCQGAYLPMPQRFKANASTPEECAQECLNDEG